MKRQASLSMSQARPAKKVKKSANQTAAAVARAEVRKELRKQTDFSWTDVTAAAGGVSSTGTVVSLLSSVTRTTDAGINYISGNTIFPAGLRVKFYWYTNQTFNTCRVLIFQWFDQSTPTVASMLQVVTAGQSVISPILYVNVPQTKVLYDETLMIAPSASGDSTVLGYGISGVRDVYIPGKRLKPVKFTAGNSPTPLDGGLYMLLITDDQLVTYPECIYYSRLTYSDGN